MPSAAQARQPEAKPAECSFEARGFDALAAFQRRPTARVLALALAGLTLLGAVNPLQGSLLTGIAGLLFFFIPQAGFWVGRSLVDDHQLRLIVGRGRGSMARFGLSDAEHPVE